MEPNNNIETKRLESKEDQIEQEILEETNVEVSEDFTVEISEDLEEPSEEPSEELSEEPSEELSEDEKKYIEKVIEDTCQMKADDLLLMGIRASGKQVWLCVSSKYNKGYPEFHQVVNDILSLKSTKFMNWLLVESRKENNLTFDF